MVAADARGDAMVAAVETSVATTTPVMNFASPVLQLMCET
jgi:hypothetical protein